MNPTFFMIGLAARSFLHSGIFIVIGAVSGIGLLNDLVAVLQKVINNNVLLGFAVIIAILWA